MGIYFHELCFLSYAHRGGAFGVTATLGRQQIHLHGHEISKLLGIPADSYRHGDYSEDLLTRHFGATSVDSFDYSAYEGATIVHDFNQPIVPAKQYDTIIDCGTSEHVFNVVQSLRNTISLCRIGGQIIHCLPADNLNGHGFWQFSAEVFFSLYSQGNGFADTEMFLAETRDFRGWYRFRGVPSDGRRFEIGSRFPTYILVHTRKTADIIQPDGPFALQQSDYVNLWESGSSDAAPAPVAAVPPAPATRRGVSIAAIAKRVLGAAPPVQRFVQRANSELNDFRYQLKERRIPQYRPDLFERVLIADAIGRPTGG